MVLKPDAPIDWRAKGVRRLTPRVPTRRPTPATRAPTEIDGTLPRETLRPTRYVVRVVLLAVRTAPRSNPMPTTLGRGCWAARLSHRWRGFDQTAPRRVVGFQA